MQTEYTKPRAVGFLSAHAVGEFAGHDWRQTTSCTKLSTPTLPNLAFFADLYLFLDANSKMMNQICIFKVSNFQQFVSR